MLVAANKIPAVPTTSTSAEFHRLGLGEPHPVRPRPTATARGTCSTPSPRSRRSAPSGGRRGRDREAGDRRAAERRQVVAAQRIPWGAARDRLRASGDDPRRDRHARAEVDGRPLILVDTAGLRRRAKVAGTVGYYAQLRAERAAERADVALVVATPPRESRRRICGSPGSRCGRGARPWSRSNKWDVGRTDLDDARARLARRTRLDPPIVVCSAKTGRGVPELLRSAVALADRRATRIPTPELNRFLADVVSRTPPPAKRGGRRLRLYYVAQVGTAPPRFAVQVNDRLISRDWAYHLENRLRDAYGLQGGASDHRLRPAQATVPPQTRSRPDGKRRTRPRDVAAPRPLPPAITRADAEAIALGPPLRAAPQREARDATRSRTSPIRRAARGGGCRRAPSAGGGAHPPHSPRDRRRDRGGGRRAAGGRPRGPQPPVPGARRERVPTRRRGDRAGAGGDRGVRTRRHRSRHRAVRARRGSRSASRRSPRS